jgi:hypothetical protein
MVIPLRVIVVLFAKPLPVKGRLLAQLETVIGGGRVTVILPVASALVQPLPLAVVMV